jgi:ABC-type dipeptide/oligopeptide/nickel transport system permease component
MFTAGTILVLITFLLLLGNLVTDLALALTDPRVRLE